MTAEISRLHPRDLATVGLQHASFVVSVRSSLPLARRTTRRLFRRFPLSDALLQHGGSEQVTYLNALFFELSKRHGPSIVVQAPSDNFLQLRRDSL